MPRTSEAVVCMPSRSTASTGLDTGRPNPKKAELVIWSSFAEMARSRATSSPMFCAEALLERSSFITWRYTVGRLGKVRMRETSDWTSLWWKRRSTSAARSRALRMASELSGLSTT